MTQEQAVQRLIRLFEVTDGQSIAELRRILCEFGTAEVAAAIRTVQETQEPHGEPSPWKWPKNPPKKEQWDASRCTCAVGGKPPCGYCESGDYTVK